MEKSYYFFLQSCLVIFFSFLLNLGLAQNDLWLTSTVPTHVTVCDSARTFSFSVVNGAGVPATAIKVILHLEAGQKYVASSLSGAGISEFNITDLQNPSFSVVNFGSANKPFSVRIASGCDLIAATGVSGGQTLQLEADLNYTTGGVAKNYYHTSLDYSKKYAALSIISVTNKNYSGYLGDTYTRVISIKNGGYGRVSTFSFTDVHTPATSITAVAGTASWASSSGTETYTVNNFTSIGNGDGYFDLNEIITITETIKVNQCATPPTTTLFTVMWGCNGQTCQSAIESASAAIPSRAPTITITPSVITSLLCDGVNYAQQIRIQNTGTGPAKAFDLDIFRGSSELGILEKPDWPAFIDLASITQKVGAGAVTSVTPTQTFTTSLANTCYGTSKIYKVRIRIDSIPVGQTILINFNVQNGCALSCNGTTYNSAGWMFSAAYKDECDNAYTKPATVGLSSTGIQTAISGDGPTDLNASTPSTFDFKVVGYSSTIPFEASGFLEVRYTLSPNLTWTNTATNLALVYSNGISGTPVIGSRTYAGNVVSIKYQMNFTTLNKAVFSIKNVVLNCAVAAVGSTGVQFELIFHPSSACSTSLRHRFCSTFTTIPHCPVPCSEGMRFDNFTLARTNYGLRDINNDGTPEAGVVDMSRAKTKYAMQGDTLKATFQGTVFGSGISFDYAYASTDMKGGAAYLTALPALLTVDRASTGMTYTCPVTALKTGNVFGYNISPAVLNGTGSLPLGFQLEENDIVTLQTYYQVSQNPGSVYDAFLEYTVLNNFYCTASPIVNGVPTGAISFCESYSGKYYLLRYYGFSNGDRIYSVANCDTLTERTDLYFGLGTCCSNFEGGNLFTSEYRLISYYNSLDYLLPTGYTFLSAEVWYYYGKGTNMIGSANPEKVTISPTNPGASELHFDLASLFTSGALSTKKGEEGHHIEFYAKIKPDCGVASGVSTSRFITSITSVPNSSSSFSIADTNVNQITYSGSNFLLSSTNSYEVSLQKNIKWEFDLVDLNAIIDLPNSFVSFASPSGKLSVSQLKDITTNTVITPNAGGIYPLGKLSSSHHYVVNAINTGCGLDSLITFTGWTCNTSYPTSLPTYSCTAKRLPLFVMKDPNSSEIQILDGTTDNSIEMCQQNQFRVKLLSSKIAYVYEPELSAILPLGMTYATNTAEILYPLKDSLLPGGGWRQIDNPTITMASSGQTIKWLMNTISQEPRFLQRGFPGVINQDSAEVWIRYKTNVNCDFVGGSVVRYRATGKDLCGGQLPTIFDASNKNKITGVSSGYVADMQTRLSSPSNVCSQPKVNVHVVFRNDSPTPTGTSDYYGVTIPSGYSYGGNFQIIRNTATPFPSTSPIQTVLSTGDTRLEWLLPSGFIGAGYLDSIVFAFDVTVPISVMACGQGTLSSRVTSKETVSCATAPGGTCTVDVLNGSASGTFNIVRPVYVISAPNFIRGNNQIQVNFTLHNTGSVNSTMPIEIELYEDKDSSGGRSAGDNLIQTFSVTNPTIIPAGSSTGVSQTFNIVSTATHFFIEIQDYTVTSSNCTCTPAFAWDDATVTLPVENAHLMGLAGTKNNLLSLEVTEGVNIHSFGLEKLTKEGEWKEIGLVLSEEATFESKRIVWHDTVPEMKETYRVGIKDIDGRVNYSNLVELSREKVEAIVMLYPNPATDKLNLAISIPATDMAHIQVVNSVGIMKVDNWHDLSQGLSVITLDVSQWASGVYFVKVQYGSIEKNQKVIINHP